MPYMGRSLTGNLSTFTKTPFMQTGGNVATFLWLLAVALKANPIGMIGIDNSFDEKRQTEYPGIPHKKVKGPYGPVFMDPVYEHYAKWHLAAIKLAKQQGVITINCNKGGAMYSEDIVDMPLKEFIEIYSKKE